MTSHPDPAKPLCFVAMPFGVKPRPGGGTIDFDRVYAAVIRPAIEDAAMAPLRADEEQAGGIIHKPMFERLILAEYAVADLTAANANVFYEVGVRHAVRPWSTVLMFAEKTQLPFDLGPLRGLPYPLDAAGRPADAAGSRAALTGLLEAARERFTDSPVFQLVEGFEAPEIDRLRTDSFRNRVEYANEVKEQLAAARDAKDLEAVAAVAAALDSVEDAEAGTVIDLFLSYRALKGFAEMVDLADHMAHHVRRTPLVREQLAFALNRLGRRDEAERLLLDLLEERGPSSETYGILGRVHKDRWQEAVASGSSFEAAGHLRRAIEAYLAGFETDWRDAYPGINAVTLMEVAQPPDDRRHELLPVVAYSARRRVEGGAPDYWDRATLFEAAVLVGDRDGAYAALQDALAAIREPWEPETTLNNLHMIVAAKDRRGEKADWHDEVVRALVRAAG